ncbi:hypothetical protein DITRI_Ditri12bG0096800 [Diplodiscus trichospermus]
MLLMRARFRYRREGPKLVEKRFKFPNLAVPRGVSFEDLGHHAGMFYFFFESRNSKKDPLASNLLYVDPIGTGFSYSSDRRDIRHNEDEVSNDLYDFLMAFFVEHPEFVKNYFYITGESYAGHYIPAFAARVHRGNKAKDGIHINLKVVANHSMNLLLVMALTDPAIQYKAYTDYALDMGVIKKTDYDRINKLVPVCEMAIKLCGNVAYAMASSFPMITLYVFKSVVSNFNAWIYGIMALAGDTNYYDSRKRCEGSLCYDFSNVETLLNKKSVRDALGAWNIDFVSCSPTVYQALLVDWMRNLEVGIPALLEDGIELLVYAGEYDLICNWLGNSRWVHAMEWSGQEEFVASSEVPFEVDGSEAGILKTHGPLGFLKVTWLTALEMLKRWTKGTLSEAADSEKLVAET